MLLPHPAAGGLITGYSQLDLLLSGKDPIYEPATLLTGLVYAPGSVLGRITAGAVTSAAKSGGNTGNGTLTVDATHPKRVGAKVGVYQVRFIAAATNNGTFRVTDPDGYVLGDVVMSGGAGAFDNDIKFAVADGSTDFAVGDGFDITVAAGSQKFTLSVAAAEDGSQVPCAVLLEGVDASGGDKNCPVIVEGYFNEEALTFGAGHTADTVRVPLRNVGIHLRTMKYSG